MNEDSVVLVYSKCSPCLACDYISYTRNLFTCKESRCKISSGVDRIAAVKPKTDSNTQHSKSNVQGNQLLAHLKSINQSKSQELNS